MEQQKVELEKRVRETVQLSRGQARDSDGRDAG